ncbi:hypothetical protein ABIB54_001949 [Frigoribacterium sp. UYMn621]
MLPIIGAAGASGARTKGRIAAMDSVVDGIRFP